MHEKARKVNALLQALQLPHNARLLNAEVVRLKAEEARRLNRAGAKRQVAYLLERVGHEGLEALVRRLLGRRRELRRLADRMRRCRRLAELARAVYQLKSCEADSVIMQDVLEQVRYVLSTPGGRDRLERALPPPSR